MSDSTYSRRVGKPLVWLQGEVKTPPFSTEARIDGARTMREQR
jgi:hypothetical protein